MSYLKFNLTNHLIPVLGLLFLSNVAFAQVRVESDSDVKIGGADAPHLSAKLDVFDSAKGFLMPRMNYTSLGSIPSPAPGLQVFCPDKKAVCTYLSIGDGWKCASSVEGGTGVSVNGSGIPDDPYVISLNPSGGPQSLTGLLNLIYTSTPNVSTSTIGSNQTLINDLVLNNLQNYSAIIVDVVTESVADDESGNQYKFNWKVKESSASNPYSNYQQQVSSGAPTHGTITTSGTSTNINLNALTSLSLDLDLLITQLGSGTGTPNGVTGTIKEVKVYGVSSLDVAVLVGPEGPQGPQGNDGQDGAPGPPVNLTIGTVNGGAPGTQPVVTLQTTGQGQVLNFTIPQGNNGAPGQDGQQGQPGSAANIVVQAGSGIDVAESGTNPKVYEVSSGLTGESGVINITNDVVGVSPGGITTSKIANGSVTTPKIAPGSQLGMVLTTTVANTTANWQHPIDGSTYNEGILSVGAGSITSSEIKSNTLETKVTLNAGNGISLSEDVPTNNITVTNSGLHSATGVAPVVVTTASNNAQVSIAPGSNNQVLTTNNGTVTWQDGLFTEVDGNVTNEGSLSVGAGSANTALINSNTLNSPSVTLNAGQGIAITENVNTNTVTIAQSNTPWLVGGNNIDGQGKFGTLTPNSHISVVTNDIEKMRVTHGGNIGIGTSNPLNRLHVVAPTETFVAKFEGVNSSVITVGDPLLPGQANTAYQNATGEMWVGMDNAGIGGITTTALAQGLSFSTAGTENMRILNNGNVGINVPQANISARLDVGGDVIVRQRTGTPSKIATFDTNGRLVEGGLITGPVGQQYWFDNSANFPNSITTPHKVNIGGDPGYALIGLADLNLGDTDNNGATNLFLYREIGNGKSGITLDGGANIAAEIYHHGSTASTFSLGLPNQNSLTVKGSVVKIDGNLRVGGGTKLSMSVFPDSVRIHKPLRDASGDLGNTTKVLSATADGSPNWVDFDGSNTNELQSLGTNGSPGNISISSGNTLTLNVDDADASLINEGVISVGAGTDANSILLSNTGNYMSNVTFTEGSGIQLTEVGNSIVITNDGDTDASNDVTTSTTAGGDLSGTYPNPTVNKIQGVTVSTTPPAAGQVLKYNSSTAKWEAATDNTGVTTELDGVIGNEITNVTSNGLLRSGSGTLADPYLVGLPAGANGQVMKFNSSTSSWEAGSDNTGIATEVDGVIGNEVTNITTNGGLVRSGSGTAVAPYTLGLPTTATTGQVMRYNGTAWIADNVTVAETDGVIGNEVTNFTTNGGLVRSGSGTAAAPYTLGLPTTATTGQVMKFNGTAWVADIETDGVIGNEVTNFTTNGGLVRSGSGTAAAPYTLGLPTTATTGQVMRYNGTAWIADNVTVAETDGIIGNEMTNVTANGLVRTGTGTGVDPYVVGLPVGTNNHLLKYNSTTAKWESSAVLLLPSATPSSNTLRSDGTNWVSSALLKNDGAKIIIDDVAPPLIATLPTTKLHVDGVVQIGKNTTAATVLIGTDVNNSIVNVPVSTAGLFVTNGNLSNAFAQWATSPLTSTNAPLPMSLTTTATRVNIPLSQVNGPFTMTTTGAIGLPASSTLQGRYKISYSYCINTTATASILYEAAVYTATAELPNTRVRKTMTAGDECYSKEVIHDFGLSSPTLELRLKASAAASVNIYSPVFSVQYMGPGAP